MNILGLFVYTAGYTCAYLIYKKLIEEERCARKIKWSTEDRMNALYLSIFSWLTFIVVFIMLLGNLGSPDEKAKW